MAIESCPDLASRHGNIVRIAECVLLVLSLRQSYLHQNPPVSAVRGPKHSVKKGKTPVLTAAEARAPLDSIVTDTLSGRAIAL